MQREVKDWQSVLGTHITVNVWLRLEKSVSNYISGVSFFIQNLIAIEVRVE
jgi:hypothetical protein